MFARRPQIVERRLAGRPGELLTEVLLRAGLRGGALPRPVIADGVFEIPLPGRRRRRLTLRPDGDGCLVRLEGSPPPWPWSVRWAERTLDRLLGQG